MSSSSKSTGLHWRLRGLRFLFWWCEGGNRHWFWDRKCRCLCGAVQLIGPTDEEVKAAMRVILRDTLFRSEADAITTARIALIAAKKASP